MKKLLLTILVSSTVGRFSSPYTNPCEVTVSSQVGGVIVPEMVAETSVMFSASAVVSFGVGSQESSAEQDRMISAMGSSSFFID